MKILRRHVLLVSVVSIMIVFSGAIIWGAARASVPDDVKPKLGQCLIDRIQLGTMDTEHDCIIVCTSTVDMYTVLDILPSEAIENIWDSLGGFHAFLTPLQIFVIARMDEVVRIDYNGLVTIA